MQLLRVVDHTESEAKKKKKNYQSLERSKLDYSCFIHGASRKKKVCKGIRNHLPSGTYTCTEDFQHIPSREHIIRRRRNLLTTKTTENGSKIFPEIVLKPKLQQRVSSK